MNFKKAYLNATDFVILQIMDDGRERAVSSEQIEFVNWIAAGNTPEVVSASWFVTIKNGIPVVAPDMDAVLLAEAKIKKKEFTRQRRRTKESEGVEFSPTPGTTIVLGLDDHSIARLALLVSVYGDTTEAEIDFKDKNQNFYRLNGATLTAALSAVDLALQNLFTAEKNFYQSIDACAGFDQLDQLSIIF